MIGTGETTTTPWISAGRNDGVREAITLADITSADWSLELGTIGGVVQGIDDIDQCIGIILTTPRGSDPLRPTFGARCVAIPRQPNQRRYSVNRAGNQFAAIAMWEPRVTLQSVSVSPACDSSSQSGAHLNVSVTWQLKLVRLFLVPRSRWSAFQEVRDGAGDSFTAGTGLCNDADGTDPNLVLADMIAAFESSSGRTLQPAQVERLLIDLYAYRESLVRNAVQYAGEQNLLAFAIFPMIDYLGGLVGVTRLQAQSAGTTIEFTLANALTVGYTVAAGTQVGSSDGQIVFATNAEVTINAGATSAT